MALTSYAIAFGSNRRSRHGSPAQTLRSAADALGMDRLSAIRTTAALGPAGRRFANAAGLLRSRLEPLELLAELKALEREYGRRRGRPWGPRVLDLDIILWSGGHWADGRLVVPHSEFRTRDFVLGPLAQIAPQWRDPVTGATVRQLLHRLRRPRPVDRASARP